MSIENNEFYIDDEYVENKNSSSFGKLLELSWDSPKYLTSLKGFFQLLEAKYISNCDFPPNSVNLQTHTLGYLQPVQNNSGSHESDQTCAMEVSPNLNFSFYLLKSMDTIKSCMISLDLIKRLLPKLCEFENKKNISYFMSTLYDRDSLQFHPELLQRLNGLGPLEKGFISTAFCHSILPKNLKNRDFYNFLLTNSFVFDIIDFDSGREFWSLVPVDLVELNHDSLVNTLNLNNADFYSYLPKFYRLLGESSAEFDDLLRFIKNKDFNIFLLLIFTLFINKIDLMR